MKTEKLLLTQPLQEAFAKIKGKCECSHRKLRARQAYAGPKDLNNIFLLLLLKTACYKRNIITLVNDFNFESEANPRSLSVANTINTIG